MNITNNVAQPSFQARLKKNTLVTQTVNKMNTKQLEQFSNALTSLSKVSPNDVVEISVDSVKSKTSKAMYAWDNIYYVGIKGDKKSQVAFKTDFAKPGEMGEAESLTPKNLIDIVKKLADPKTEESKTVFANREQRDVKKEVFDLLA